MLDCRGYRTANDFWFVITEAASRMPAKPHPSIGFMIRVCVYAIEEASRSEQQEWEQDLR